MIEVDDRQMEMLNIFMGVCRLLDEVGCEADGSTNKLIAMRFTPQKVISLDCTSSSLCKVGWKLMYSLAEEDRTLLSTMTRQFLHTHRPFKATIMNPAGEPILWVSKLLISVAGADRQIRRPFAFINSRIYVHAAEGNDARLVGEAQQLALSHIVMQGR